MKEPKLQIAQCAETGDFKSIFEVAVGAECGCVAPGLGVPVVAKNKGKKPGEIIGPGRKIAHFAIAKGYDAQAAFETALHLLAKHVFAQRKELFIPAVEMSRDFYTRLYAGLENLYPESWDEDARGWLQGIAMRNARRKIRGKSNPKIFQFEKVESEILFKSRFGEFRADSVGSIRETLLVVEFKVTHEVDEAKKKRIRSLGNSCLEIDLSEFHQIDKEGGVNFKGMSELLRGKGGAKFEWIHNEKWPQIEDSVFNEVLRDALHTVQRKVAKDKRERDRGFFQKRKKAGYQVVKVYGYVTKSVYCPDLGGAETHASSCRKCKFFGEHFYFPDRDTGKQVQLALCGCENEVRTNVLTDLKRSLKKR